MKTVLITGANGQLGYELQKTVSDQYHIIAADVEQLDITVADSVQNVIKHLQPDIVINAAAYTNVDKAESDVLAAYKVNVQGALNLALATEQRNIPFVHISTDFIFDGEATKPYTTAAKGQPLGIYGITKYTGEQKVLMAAPESLVVRTSWLYSAHSNNFVKTMLRLMQEKDSLNIVSDQIGTPTWARTLAETLWLLIEKQAQGIYHCSDNGIASWYDFAIAIQEEALEFGLLDKKIPLHPIPTSDYPTPAKRPLYSVMDKSKTENLLSMSLADWRVSLRKMLSELS